MEATFGRLAGFLVLSVAGFCQPLPEFGTIVSIDADNDAIPEVIYISGGSQLSSQPEDWMIGLALEPWGDSRVVRRSSSRLPMLFGESVDSNKVAVTNYFTDPPFPPVESYSLSILYFRAIKHTDWISRL